MGRLSDFCMTFAGLSLRSLSPEEAREEELKKYAIAGGGAVHAKVKLSTQQLRSETKKLLALRKNYEGLVLGS